jgi:hypothetical protein
MDSPIDEIRDDLESGSFSEAEKKSKRWLESFPLSEKNSFSYERASEAYIYARFFLHRQDSIQRIITDEQRARYYLQLLKEINQLRLEKKYEKMDNPLWNGVDNFLNARIAENYARAFAGQKSFNLDQNEIIQLSVSLLKLEKWKSAIDSLNFLLRLNRHNAQVNYLIAYAYAKTGELESSHEHFRRALFHKPELISEYPEFIPTEVFEKIWNSFRNGQESGQSIYREYALLLELNDVFKNSLELSEKELSNLEKEFQQKLALYEKKSTRTKNETAELLHYLCWLVICFQKSANYEKHELYRQKMILISPESWEAFQKKRNVI